MATILVDFENVTGTQGLNGVECLTKKDYLCIFYSDPCRYITKVDSRRIEESGCTFRVCQLVKSRRNALDFYIATEAGMAYEAGERNIIIVSKDEGLDSIHDFFQARGLKAQIINESTIIKGLLRLTGEEYSIRNELLKDYEKVLLPEICARMNERKALKEAIMECLSGTEFEEDISRVLDYIDRVGTTSKKDLYRGSLHEFGRESGTVIYNMLKQVM